MSRDPRLGRRQGRGGPYGLGGLGGYTGPGGPAKPDGPRISRRTLLRMGGALSIAAVGGGTVELLLNTVGAPAGAPTQPDTTQPGTATTRTTASTRSSATTPTTESSTTTTVDAPTNATQVAAHKASAPSKYFGPSTDRHVYVTIDDGYFPDNRVIDLIRSEHVPITTFLITEAASEHLSFWKSFVTAGGQIQNHTYSHPDLTTLTQGGAESQWARANKSFASWFGRAPTIGRPPYGAVDTKVAQAAREAGLDSMILWSALDDGDGIQTWNKGPIAPGSIILLHWTPGLYAELTTVLQSIDDHHLVPAFLTKA